MMFKALALSFLLLAGCNTDDLLNKDEDTAGSSQMKVFEVANAGSHTIADVRIADKGSGIWGQNILGRTMIRPGAAYRTQRQCDKVYDLLAKYTDAVVVQRFNVSLPCQEKIGIRWTLLY